jgi:F-type H+-transporting ATPase subunit c
MSPEIVKLFTMGGMIAVGIIGPAIAMGMIASKGLESIGRNPETEKAVRSTMIIGLGFVESLFVLTLVISFIVRYG